MRWGKPKQQLLFSTLPQLNVAKTKIAMPGGGDAGDTSSNGQNDSCLEQDQRMISGNGRQQDLSGDPLAAVDFVYIPPGVFLMGSPEEEPTRDRDETLHEVTLSRGFLMQATLVTQRQWRAVMGANPASFCKAGAECPVEGVSWWDCQEFIKKCNALGPYRYRLPTEAEWEYACRAGSSGAFAQEDIEFAEDGRAPSLDRIAWYHDNSHGKTHPVAQKSPNAWGLYDMHGNLCEWCEDWYRQYSAKPQQDPVATKSGSRRVGRGGCWVSPAGNCRCASRFSWVPGYRSDFVGLRLVREL